MCFKFPLTYSELSQHHLDSQYKVRNKNQVADMDERIWILKLNQLNEGFKSMHNIIEDPIYFDFFYYLVEHLDQHQNIRVQQQLIETLSFQIQELDSKKEQAFRMTLFLLLNLLKQKSIQYPQTKTCLRLLNSIFHLPIIKSLEKEACKYFFDIARMAQDIKDQQMREIWIQFLIQSLKIWPQYQSQLRERIINLMYEQEHVIQNIAKLIIACFNNDATKVYAIDQIIVLINYISQNSSSQTESVPVKNLREIVKILSKEIPKIFSQQLAGLLELYDNENYQIRNTITDILANVIEFIVLQNNQDDRNPCNIDNMITQLISRYLDKAGYCRSNCINHLTNLIINNCIPKHFLNDLLDVALSRMKDISGHVRKASLQLTKAIIKYYTAIFVVSQGRKSYWSEEEVQALWSRNKQDLQIVQEDIKELSQNYQNNVKIQEDELEQIKSKASEITKGQKYLEEYISFVKILNSVMAHLLELCSSKQQQDVIQSIKVISYLKKYDFENSQIGLNKMILLIWSQDKSIQQEISKKFYKIFFKNKETTSIINDLVALLEKAKLKELISIEKIIQTYQNTESPYQIPFELFCLTWNILMQKQFLANYSSSKIRAILNLIRIQILPNKHLLNQDRVAQLSSLIIKYSAKDIDWSIIRECTLILVRQSQYIALDKTINSLIQLLLQHQGTSNLSYFSACEAILQLISNRSDSVLHFESLLHKMSKFPVENNSETQEDEIDEQLFLTHSIYVAGTVALQYIIQIDQTHRQLKIVKSEIENNEDDEEEIDKISGGLEGDFDKLHEIVNQIQNDSLFNKNILAVYSRIVELLIKQSLGNAQSCQSPLIQISVLTMCKFMCVSESYCEKNIEILFEIIKSQKTDQVMKNNVIISIGDLLHRWPNTVQQFHKQIYSNLTDQSATVRRVTLLVLTHLILNDMIKSKTSLIHIPLLLSDPHPQIPPMARYFLNELSKKEQRAISNALPDIILNVQEHNESIFHQIAQYIDKHQIDSIVDRLITTMANSENDYEVKNVALVLNLIPLNQSSLQKLLDGFEEYRQKLKDDYVQTQFQHLVKKFRKALNAEAKPMIDEYESKIENHSKETFDGRRREIRSKHTKQLISSQQVKKENLQVKKENIQVKTRQLKRRVIKND